MKITTANTILIIETSYQSIINHKEWVANQTTVIYQIIVTKEYQIHTTVTVKCHTQITLLTMASIQMNTSQTQALTETTNLPNHIKVDKFNQITTAKCLKDLTSFNHKIAIKDN
jgi:hypothetical protein